MREEARRLRRHVAAGMLSAGVVGIADGFASLAATHSWFGASLATPLLAAATLLVPGALAGIGAYIFEHVVLRRGLVPWLRTSTSEARDRAVWALALGAAVLALGALGAMGAARYVAFAVALQDETFAAQLSMLVWGLAFVAVVLLALPLAIVLHAAMRPIAAAATAARRSASLAVHLVALGAAALALHFARAHAEALGPALVAPYACAIAALLVLAWLHPTRAALLRIDGKLGFWLAAALAFAVSAPAPSASPALRETLARSPGPAALADLFARATDFDRDGQSSLFGGTDCAAFDPRRGALAVDVPGNGIDEDCDGHDATRTRGSARAAPTTPLPPEFVKPYNVVLIVVDALRADRLQRTRGATLTPFLDLLATESVVFREAFSQSPSTRISFPSFLSGHSPAHLNWTRRNGIVQSDGKQRMLAERMRRLGYETGLVVTRWIHSRLKDIFRGYDSVFNVRSIDGIPISPALSSPSSTARAVEFIERNQSARSARPFFLTLYYDAPHSPYVDRSAEGIRARSKRDVDRYDGEIRHVDREVGHFLAYLRVKPKLWPNTVVIVTSDHGEEFREHGGRYHDRTCYRESTHVPLIVRVPDLAPAFAPARVALLDLVPTVLALVGGTPDPKLEGRNLLSPDPARYAHALDARVSCTYFPDAKPASGLLQAVRDDRWLYVRNIARGTSEVYDTVADRAEKRNLFDAPTGAAVAQRLAGESRPPEIRAR